MTFVESLSALPLVVQLLIVGVFGLLVGSFLNVVILRLPKKVKWEWTEQSAEWLKIAPKDDSPPPAGIALEASHCPKCKTKIKPWHNLPLIGYLLLRGKCAACQQPISIRYPLVEFITAVLTIIVIWKFGLTLAGGLGVILTWTLIVQTGIDFDNKLLLDEITLPILWLGILASLVPVYTSPTDAIIGAVAGYLSLWSVFQLFKLVTGKEGMGFGDFKLLALLGAWLGWQFLPQIILISTLLGSLVGITLIISKKMNRENPIPFGPYIAAAGYIALIWGEQINQKYLSLLT